MYGQLITRARTRVQPTERARRHKPQTHMSVEFTFECEAAAGESLMTVLPGGRWDAEQQRVTWEVQGPRGSNDALHDNIVLYVQEFKLTDILRTDDAAAGFACSYSNELERYEDGVAKHVDPYKQCSYELCDDGENSLRASAQW
eukprot:SAG31_NODE_11190_length_1056_cov_1.467085_2_plen_144_part_00